MIQWSSEETEADWELTLLSTGETVFLEADFNFSPEECGQVLNA